MSAMELQPSLLTQAEVAAIVRSMRGQMAWSQETLAEFAGLTVATVQRLEAEQFSSVETKRAVAGAFGWSLAFFDTPRAIPSAEEMAVQKAAFHLEYFILDAFPIDSCGIVTRLTDAVGAAAMMPCSLAELPRTAQDAFAVVADYVHNSLNDICEASAAQAAYYVDELSALTLPLLEAGYRLQAAIRQTMVSNPAWSDPTPMPLTLLYMIAVPDGHLMTHCAVRRRIAM